MYVETVPNRNSPPAILLREGWREAGKVRKRTLANLSHWPTSKIETLRALLKDEPLVRAETAFAIESSRAHGHVEALLAMVRRIGLDRLIAPKRSRRRDLVVAMLVERLIHGASKLATTRLWHTTTLAESLALEDCEVDELYEAMDWLLARQGGIEERLAGRHLGEDQPVFYDVTSSYYEGRTCPLMRFGHNRDGKRGKTQVVYGALCAAGGLPVAVRVYPGNVGDPTTVEDQVESLRERFGLERVVLVGDRGMLTEARIAELKRHPGLGWISALRTGQIRRLVEGEALQLSLFDRRNLAEITCEAYPGERLMACFNPLLAEARARKRAELLTASETHLAKLAAEVARRRKTPLGAAEIGRKLGRFAHRYKVAKHFEFEIEDGHFAYRRRDDAIAAEARLDGIYVIRTSEPAERLSAEDTVRGYKGLAQVERLFRGLKGLEIRIRPIRHRDEGRVRAHIFLCLLAGYLEWHLRRAWAPLLFDDEGLAEDRKTRDPVAPAEPSPRAKRKKARRTSEDGVALHSFQTLIAALATRCRNTCRIESEPEAPTVTLITEPTPLQRRAQQLIEVFPVPNRD